MDMPKQKRYKNLLKVANAANSSQDKSAIAANASQDKLAAANSSRDKLAATANSFRDKSVTTTSKNSSHDKSIATRNASLEKSATATSRNSSSSQTLYYSKPSSIAPTTSEHPPEARHKCGRESKHYWTIDAIDEYEVSTRLHLLLKDVHNFPEGLHIVVNFDKLHATIGEAIGLLTGVCGQLATDCVAFPINFEKWLAILESKTEIINNAQEDIAPYQWTLLVEYRLKPETQVPACDFIIEVRDSQFLGLFGLILGVTEAKLRAI
ncbi:uncharacterized protein LOC107615364 [Arachis ipaensis]|uniref:uncharacterized protein LOC107615364 n=1 Tax=Arachis ipaensis TaxID=130454 RepID=UPI000A2B82CA|nr:uncharacterized protein LOC107615364 [Arachis ipaensis]